MPSHGWPTDGRIFLRPDHPKHHLWQAALQFEPDDRARQLSGALIGSCPADALDDPPRAAEHLQAMQAHAIQAMAAEMEQTDINPRLDTAHSSLIEATQHNNDLEQLNRQRMNLGSETIDGPIGKMTRADNRAKLQEYQQIAAQREAGGDTTHREVPGTDWRGHAVTAVIAALEVVVTIRIFNVDITQLDPTTFLPWMAVTVALAFFNGWVSANLGKARRKARELLEAQKQLHTDATFQTHAAQPPTDWEPRIDDGDGNSGTISRFAPSPTTVRRAVRTRGLAYLLWGIPLTLLMVGMYWRLGKMAAPLDLGFFTWVFPAIIVTVVASLLWVLVVEPNARGNLLGDYLRSARAADDDSARNEARLLNAAHREDGLAQTKIVASRGELNDAKGCIEHAVQVTYRGLQLAHGVLGVRTIVKADPDNLRLPSIPRADGIASGISEQEQRRQTLLAALDIPALEPLRDSMTPMGILDRPRNIPADPRHVDWGMVAPYSHSVLADPGRSVGADEPDRGVRGWFRRNVW